MDVYATAPAKHSFSYRVAVVAVPTTGNIAVPATDLTVVKSADGVFNAVQHPGCQTEGRKQCVSEFIS